MKFKQTVLAGSIMLATTLTPMIDAQAENKKFNDVPQDHWSFNAITDLANKKYCSRLREWHFLVSVII